MTRFFEVGRTWRMCLKEMKETLRDRRTVATLLLMPLLVYPLLSVALNRLFLGAKKSFESRTYWIGVSTFEELEQLERLIQAGRAVQDGAPSTEFRIERLDSRQNQSLDGSPEVGDLAKRSSIASFRIILSATQLETLVASEEVDIGLRFEPERKENVGAAEQDEDARKSSKFHVSIAFRQEDPKSENALREIESILKAINDAEVRKLLESLNVTPQPSVTMQAKPVVASGNSGLSLVAIIPLVLLLMTITGAVYPAIDLTAGERERGTMEALIASPVPRYELLLSKYVAVVFVAFLTALANVTAMWITLWATGLGKLILGREGLSFLAVLQVLPLLLLFASFFSAILLALCSFAKSFKEAQAYLIPVMLIALAPGVLSLLPGIQLTPTLAIIPLVNVILLARDLLSHQAQFLPSAAAVFSTIAYASAAVGLASRLFGTDATSHGSEGTWGDLFRRPAQTRPLPSLGHLAALLAMNYPLYFVLSNGAGRIEKLSLSDRLLLNCAITCLLFLVMPILFAWFRRLRGVSTFRLAWSWSGQMWTWIGVSLLASSLWMGAHELFLFSKTMGWATIDESQFAAAEATRQELKQLPLWLILFTSAIGPAIAEEIFFRGFVLSSMHSLSAFRAVLFSSILFGLFHTMSGSVMTIERLLPSTFLGLALGFATTRTGSLFPSIVLHALHNGFLFTLAHQQEAILSWGWGIQEGEQLPNTWLIYGAIAGIVGLGLIAVSNRRNEG